MSTRDGTDLARKAVIGFLGAGVVVASVNAGLATSPAALVVSIAALAGIVLATVAFLDFERFVLALLVLRTSLDVVKIGRGQAQLVDPASQFAALFLVAGSIWLAARVRARGWRWSPLRLALLAFLGAGVLSSVTSLSRLETLVECVRIAAVVLMFIVLEELIAERDAARRVVIAVALSAVVPLVMAVAAAGSLSDTRGGFTRLTSTFQQSNAFGRYLMLVVVVGAALLPYVHGRVRALAAVGVAGSGAALILTYSRSAWAGTLLGVVVVGARMGRRFVFALVALVVIVALAAPSVVGRLSDLGEIRDEEGNPSNTFVWRLDYWRQVASEADRNPVTGVGLRVTQSLTERGKLPHNDFLRAFVETGVVGLAAYLWLLYTLVAAARRAVRSAPEGLPTGLALGFAGCVAGIILVSTVSNVMSQVIVLWYFFALAAVATRITAPPSDPSPRLAARVAEART